MLVKYNFSRSFNNAAKGSKRLLVASMLSIALITTIATPATTNKAHATATILIPGQVGQVGGLISVVHQYAEMVEQWSNSINEYLTEFGLDQWIEVRMGFHHQRNEEANYGERSASRLMFGEVDQDGLPQRVGHYNRKLLNIITDGANQISSNAIERILPPPQPAVDGEIDEEDVAAIRDHARLLSMETYTEPAPEKYLNTSYGTEYELARISYIQQQLLAQDSIKQYPLHAGFLKGQADKALTITTAAEDGNTNAATLLSLQVIAQSELNSYTSLALLESSLRQERILGALLAIKAKDRHLGNIDALNESEF